MKTYSRSSKKFLCDDSDLPKEYITACRLCLRKDEGMIDIFNENELIPLCLKIRSVTSLEVSEDDGLPPFMCGACGHLLDSAYSFKMRCLSSSLKLRPFCKASSRELTTENDGIENETLLDDSLTVPENGRSACTVNEQDMSHYGFFSAVVNRCCHTPSEQQPDTDSSADLHNQYVVGGIDCYEEPETNNSCEVQEPLPKGIKDICGDWVGSKEATDELHDSSVLQLNCEQSESEITESENNEQRNQLVQLSVVCNSGNIKKSESVGFEKLEETRVGEEQQNDKTISIIESHELVDADAQHQTTRDYDKRFRVKYVKKKFVANTRTSLVLKSSGELGSSDDIETHAEWILPHSQKMEMDSENEVSNDLENEPLANRLKTLDQRRERLEVIRRKDRKTDQEAFELMLMDHLKGSEGSRPSTDPAEGSGLCMWCSKCSVMFNNELELKYHIFNKHFSMYHCDQCQKYFTNKSMLLRHMRTHTGEKPFRCELCDRSFSQKEILQRHVNIHSTIKPFKCRHCSKMFSQKESLKNHIFIHHTQRDPSDIQRFRCQLCNKAFCHNSGLSRHMLSHSGVVFGCAICNRNFSDASSVRRHQMKRHPEIVMSDSEVDEPDSINSLKLE